MEYKTITRPDGSEHKLAVYDGKCRFWMEGIYDSLPETAEKRAEECSLPVKIDRRAGDGRKAEYTACAFHDGICVCVVRDLHINDRLTHGNLAVRNVRHAALEVFQQTVLEGLSVETLKHDLAALEQ